MVVLLLFALQIASLQSPAMAIGSAQPMLSSEYSRVSRVFGPRAGEVWEMIKSHNIEIKCVANIFFAVFIGFAGALAFYVGVHFGFISPESRNDITKYIGSVRSIALFAVLGGVVAGVFQWAQPATLAPIQAFVLGATWPSVVTSIMAGSSSPPPAPTATAVVSSVPASSVTTIGQPSKAEVVIAPPPKDS
jgi:hypothetical protein